MPSIEKLPQDKKIILFDGFCHLCDSSIQFIIRQDTKDIFRFVSLQSELGIQIKAHIVFDSQTTDSLILYERKKEYYTKSKAVFKIARKLGGCFVFLAVFELLPTPITDKIYDFIAKNRYKWFGKKENCMVPSRGFNSKFLGFEKY